MNIIKQLPPEQAQRIAAGQVVERPANIVKELIENSIDAGATRIELYVERGGHQLIRVVDNGCGMSPDDAHTCFGRHATSKLTAIDQLPGITTFGFRGEALACIAAVSKVTLITKQAQNELGTQITITDGVTTDTSVSATTGTDIAVRDLFYNVPARKKFLKKETTEWRAIQQLLQACALSFLSKHFTLYHDGRQITNCPPVTRLTERMAQLYTPTICKSIIPLTKQTGNGIQLTGAISNHHYFRYDRSNIFFFVNNRWVKNQELARALLKGYLNVLPQGRYPIGCISITIDPQQVDINTHPRKEEVQFLHPRRLTTLLTAGVKTSLEQHLSAQLKRTVTFAPSTETTLPTHPAFGPNTPSYTMPPMPPRPSTPTQPILSSLQTATPMPYAQSPIMENEEQATGTQLTADTGNNYAIIGQLQNTYILLEHEEGLFVVDQHAAHERVLYEQFRKRFGNIATIELLFPQMIELPQDDMALIEPHLELLQKHGIAIEPFGATQLRITATPLHAKHAAFDQLIKEMIGWLKDFNEIPGEQLYKQLHEKLHAQMACKSAIKAGDILPPEKMRSLLDQLYKCENRFICAHGRPTGWLMRTYEIEKKFKRIV